MGVFQMFSLISDLLLPALMMTVSCVAMAGKKDVYTLLITGASDGLDNLKRIAPALIVLLTAIHMLRASGALELLTQWFTPICTVLGIPPQTIPLVLIRPISGSAALAVGSELMASYGVDSLVGRTAAIMLGSTETTFYTISIYFGAAGIRQTRYAVPAALLADLTGFFMASLTAKVFF